MRELVTRRLARWGPVAALAIAVLAAPAPALAQRQLPPLEDLLEEAETAEDSLAITEAYRAAQSLQQPAGVPREVEREPGPSRPPRGPSPADTTREEIPGDERAPAVGIPQADPLYQSLLGEPDTAAPGEGPITYQGERLVFYPRGEVIVLQGEAAAEQARTRLEAQRILYRPREGLVEAFERASVARGEQRLVADSLFYDRTTGAVATFGATDIEEATSQTQGVDVIYDLERRSGKIGAGRTIYEPWILDAVQMNKVGASTFMLAKGYFTTCELEDPHYTFRADEIKLRQDDVIVARPVVLYFSDIPVFFLPWYVEPVTRGRATGFLRPKIGINTLLFGSGQERNVQDIGYYWAINEFSDARFSTDIYTESRFILRGDFRYNLRHEFSGRLNVEQVWNRLQETSSRLIRFSHDHPFSPNTRATVDVNWSNSRSFLRRNSFDTDEILQRSFRSAGNYSTRFDWGSFVAGADADFELESNRVDFRLPSLRLSINQRPLWGAREAGAGAPIGERPWYRKLQYSANASFLSRLSRAQVDSLGQPVRRVPTDSLGNPIETDRETVVDEQEASSRVTLNGPLDLLGVLQTTPSLSYSMSLENDALAEGQQLGGRGQLATGLQMSSRFFRVFPSMPGPWFTAMRHTVSPSVGIRYSPEPNLFGSARVDGATTGRESFTANFSIGQDFDVKMPVREEQPEDAPVETEAADDPDVPDDADRQVEEEQQQTRKVTLLSVVNSFAWDILREREEGRIGLGNLSTRLNSEIGRDFNISMTMDHELVDRGGPDEDDQFSPFLSRITTDFSLRRGASFGVSRRRGVLEGGAPLAGRGGEDETQEAKENLAAGRAPGAEGFGPWSVSLTHQWSRTREGAGGRQSLGVNGRLLPTSNWSLNYRTTYDITNGELQGQTLSLVRDLHDWQATLGINVFPSEPQDRVLISFAVYLREVPDLEVPYRVRRE